MDKHHIESIFNEMLEDISDIKYKLNKYEVKTLKLK